VADLRAPSWAEITKEVMTELPEVWQQHDIGAGNGGGGVQTNGVMVLRGVGLNIDERFDAFHFASQPVGSNFAIVVKVLDLRSGQPWAKAGLMAREELTAGSKHASIFGTAGHGLIFNYRPVTNRETFDSTDLRLDVPYWLKLVRWGNVFSGYASTNGTDWRLVERVIVEMTNHVYIGFALASRSREKDCIAWFDEFRIEPATEPEGIPVTGTRCGGRGGQWLDCKTA
jgi:regulation of enolase protein 1 (concanavalin A-like superfamily)